MTTLSVDTVHKDSLSANGYAINEWVGFSDHFVPIYAHHPVSDKKVGDVVFKVRVGDPRTLNNGEATYIAHKASQGYFTWKPGDECRKRTFKNLQFDKRPGGGVVKTESAPYMGCAWCRDATTTPTPLEPVAETPPLAVAAVSTAAQPPAPVSTEDVLHCRQEGCGKVFTGEHAVKNRALHLSATHKIKSSTTRRKARRAPDEGSAKES